MIGGEMDVVLDSAGAGILVLDASMRILFCDRKLSELFRVEEPAVPGRICRDVICPAQAGTLRVHRAADS